MGERRRRHFTKPAVTGHLVGQCLQGLRTLFGAAPLGRTVPSGSSDFDGAAPPG